VNGGKAKSKCITFTHTQKHETEKKTDQNIKQQ